MGLSNFPGASEGVLPVLVMNTVLSVALIKSMMRSLLHVMGVRNVMVGPQEEVAVVVARESRRRVVSVAQYKSMSQNSQKRGKRRREGRLAMVECCVCLCGFEAEQEVSELSCKHLFHKGCLEKWFDNDHATCPLCRSVN